MMEFGEVTFAYRRYMHNLSALLLRKRKDAMGSCLVNIGRPPAVLGTEEVDIRFDIHEVCAGHVVALCRLPRPRGTD